jgi:hypothetical protein
LASSAERSSASGLGGKVSNGAGGSRGDSEVRRSVAMGGAERTLWAQ